MKLTSKSKKHKKDDSYCCTELPFYLAATLSAIMVAFLIGVSVGHDPTPIHKEVDSRQVLYDNAFVDGEAEVFCMGVSGHSWLYCHNIWYTPDLYTH